VEIGRDCAETHAAGLRNRALRQVILVFQAENITKFSHR
jgi:hypothetical protein